MKKTNKKNDTLKKTGKNELTKINIEMFHKGINYESYNILGSHLIKNNNKSGVQFVTWAPNAENVYVVGDFNNFNVLENYKMKLIDKRGLWKLFIEGIETGVKYQYAVRSKLGDVVYKADPYAISCEIRPHRASIVFKPKRFKWDEAKWKYKKKKFNMYKSPINIYEMHLGSWRRKENNEILTYEELSKILPQYVSDMGYTHVEFMPIFEHPLDKSWGYQITGYYCPTSRYGNVDDLKILIKALHDKGIFVIFDWVPGHFCNDSYGLRMFDGTPTYEYYDEWKSKNNGWGTSNFDLGKPEVKSFLISNAFYWIKEFHIDGLRVDAVSNIIYLDYDKKEWLPNKYGDNKCLEGIQFLKDLNKAINEKFPNTMMIAEESTAWPNVSKRQKDGLGFDFKWDMGWMNDTLKYCEMDPIYRKYHHNKLNFSMMYNYSENFILPLSHDEVVHGKKSLVDKMWGDYWNKFAGLRLLMTYMIGHPGKKLVFMGAEFGQFIEWREYEELEWKLIRQFDQHKKTQMFFKDLNYFYKLNSALWESDFERDGFEWIDPDNSEKSIISFIRKSNKSKEILIFVCNFTPVVYYDFKIKVKNVGNYKEVFNSDDEIYGGSGQVMKEILFSETNLEGETYIKVKVPPMAATVLKYIKNNDI